MESVEKKKRRIPVKWERLILLFVCAAALTVVLLLTRQAAQPEPVTAAPPVDTSVTLFEYPAGQVVGMTIQRSGEAPWTVEIDEESGCFRLTGEEGALPQQLRRHGEGGAGSQCHTAHSAVRGVVILLDSRHGVSHNFIHRLHHAVRRQTAVLDAQIHAAAAHVEAHAQRIRCRFLRA